MSALVLDLERAQAIRDARAERQRLLQERAQALALSEHGARLAEDNALRQHTRSLEPHLVERIFAAVEWFLAAAAARGEVQNYKAAVGFALGDLRHTAKDDLVVDRLMALRAQIAERLALSEQA